MLLGFYNEVVKTEDGLPRLAALMESADNQRAKRRMQTSQKK